MRGGGQVCGPVSSRRGISICKRTRPAPGRRQVSGRHRNSRQSKAFMLGVKTGKGLSRRKPDL